MHQSKLFSLIPIGRAVMDEYFTAKNKSKTDDLVQLLLSMSRSDLSPEFAARVLKFFNKLFAMHEKNPQDEPTERLCSSLSKVCSASSESSNFFKIRIKCDKLHIESYTIFELL